MGRKGWGRLGAGLAAALGLAGCATGSGAYTEPEQARIDAYERAAEQILQSRGMKGPAPAVRVGTDPSLAGAGRPAGYYTDQGRRIVVNRAAVADDYIAQAVLSQELAHYVLGHADGLCSIYIHSDADKAMAVLSLFSWLAVLYGGRMLPFIGHAF